MVVGVTPAPKARRHIWRSGSWWTSRPRSGRLVQAVRRLFDLDADIAAIDDALAADPALAPWRGGHARGAAARRGRPVRDGRARRAGPAGVGGRRTDVLRAHRGRVRRTPRTTARNSDAPVPGPEALAEAPLERVGLTRARAQTVRRLAEAVATGTVDLSGAADHGATLDALGQLPGVGPWTRSMIAMRVLRDPDAFCETDLGVRRGAEVLGLPTDPRALLARADALAAVAGLRGHAPVARGGDGGGLIPVMGRYLRLLRNRPFAALWAGSTVSAVGDAMTWVAIAWIGFERGGAGLVAALVVVSTAPVIVGGLTMGVALDRFERRRVLLVVNPVLGLTVALVPLWSAVAGQAPTWLLFVVGGLYGLLKMANWAGVPSLIPDLVGDGRPRHGERHGVGHVRHRRRRRARGGRGAHRPDRRRARARRGRRELLRVRGRA